MKVVDESLRRASLFIEAHASATAGGVATEGSTTPRSPAIWYVVLDHVTEQQRKMLFTITAQMNLRETEIEPFGERGIKIGRPLAIDDANALMSRFLEAGIVSRKMSSTANSPGNEPRMHLRATGVDGELQLFETMVRIKRNQWGVSAGKGDKDIQIAQISSIQLRRPGLLTDGHIQLSIAGGVAQQESGAQGDSRQGMGENSVSFNERQASAFQRIRDVIESRMVSGEATTDSR